MDNSPRRETAGGISLEGCSIRVMPIHPAAHSHYLGEPLQIERHGCAAKMRLARAVLGWSQTELGTRIGLTQRAIHKLEQGETEPRRATVQALQAIWREQNIEFEELTDGGFRVIIRSSVLDRPPAPRSRRGRAARTRVGRITVHRARKTRS